MRANFSHPCRTIGVRQGIQHYRNDYSGNPVYPAPVKGQGTEKTLARFFYVQEELLAKKLPDMLE